MSISQKNIHFTYKTKLLSLRAEHGGALQSPSAESLPHIGEDPEFSGEEDFKHDASTLSPKPNQPSLPKLQRRQATNPYLTQPAVEIYGDSMTDYILNHRLFWHWVPEDKLTRLSISSVVEATLNQGNEKDISDMFNMIGVEKAADVFKHGISGFRTNYREDTISYFNDYFMRHVSGYSH